MNFDEKDLLLAQKEGIISSEVFSDLLRFLKSLPENSAAQVLQAPQKRKFTIENFLYYFGAMLIISTMGWYLGNTYEAFGNNGLLVISVLYFVIFTFIGNFLWKQGKTAPGGLLYVCAVSIVPLGVWAFEKFIGIMPGDYHKYSDFHILIRSGFILMELATIAVGLAFLKFRKFPFLTLPICYAMWYLSMDIVPFCLGKVMEPTWGMRNFATFLFAIIMLGFALKFDKKTKEDYSGWLYIFGGTMLWWVIASVLGQFRWDNEFAYFSYAIFAVFYMIFSVIVQRKVFMVWGALGMIAYITHLAYVIFKDSPIFPLVLIALGLAIIFAGIYYAKNCKDIEETLRKIILK